MRASKGGGYLSCLDRHNSLGEGFNSVVCLYLDVSNGELVICGKPQKTWSSTLNTEVTNNKALVAALIKTLEKLSKEK